MSPVLLNLSEQSTAFITASIESRRFQNADEAVGEALRLPQIREEENAAKLERLRRAIDIGRQDRLQKRMVGITAGGERACLATLGRSGKWQVGKATHCDWWRSGFQWVSR